MSSDFAVKVNAVSKAYAIWASPSARLHGPILGRLGQLPFLPAGVRTQCQRLSHESFRRFYALKDVSLEIRKGESIGIIGRNGSGKSTLLQIIAGTLQPTEGDVAVQGRVGALLELGSGFNPEFTGRENVYLNASILGLDRAETDARFAEIAAFADIGDFIEQPVKIYSSGMVVRLAFAVAACIEPEVLIVDEALSVGDERFQRKCFARLEAIKERGGTLLFVSHGVSAVVQLCDRVFLLEHGELLLTGRPKFVVSRYHRLLFAPGDRAAEIRQEIKAEKRQGADESADIEKSVVCDQAVTAPAEPDVEEFLDPGLIPQSTVTQASCGALISNARILSETGEPVNVLVRRRDYIYTYDVTFTETSFKVFFAMSIKSVSGFPIGGGRTHMPSQSIEHVDAGTVMRVEFKFRCLLLPGAYFLNAAVRGLMDGAITYLHRLMDVAMFRVQPEQDLLGTNLVDFYIEPRVRVVGKEGTIMKDEL